MENKYKLELECFSVEGLMREYMFQSASLKGEASKKMDAIAAELTRRLQAKHP